MFCVDKMVALACLKESMSDEHSNANRDINKRSRGSSPKFAADSGRFKTSDSVIPSLHFVC